MFGNPFPKNCHLYSRQSAKKKNIYIMVHDLLKRIIGKLQNGWFVIKPNKEHEEIK